DLFAALLLPPPGGDLGGGAALHLAPEREGGAADLRERPARLDADVDVHAGLAGRLDVAGAAHLLQHLAGGAERDADGVAETGAGLRVEVDAKLVGMVDVVPADGPRVERERAEVRGPGDHGGLGGADLVGGAAAGERDPDGPHPVGRALGDALLV